MKIRNLVLGLMLLGAMTAQAKAQEIRLGLEAGANLANWQGIDVDSSPTALTSRIGFIGGAFFQVNLGPVFAIELEALYTQKGSEAEGGLGTFDLAYVDVPLLLKYYFPTPEFKPNVFVGGSAGFNTVAQVVSSGGGTTQIEDMATEFSVIAGVGVDINKFSVNLRYQLGVTDINETSQIQNGTFSLMVGYSFI